MYVCVRLLIWIPILCLYWLTPKWFRLLFFQFAINFCWRTALFRALYSGYCWYCDIFNCHIGKKATSCHTYVYSTCGWLCVSRWGCHYAPTRILFLQFVSVIAVSLLLFVTAYYQHSYCSYLVFVVCCLLYSYVAHFIWLQLLEIVTLAEMRFCNCIYTQLQAHAHTNR